MHTSIRTVRYTATAGEGPHGCRIKRTIIDSKLPLVGVSLFLLIALLAMDTGSLTAQAQQLTNDTQSVDGKETASKKTDGSESDNKFRKNAVEISGDFLYGQGHVTLPFFYSLRTYVAPDGTTPYAGLPQKVETPPRDSDYGGATLSYSRGRAFYLDFAYAHGSSSGTQDINQPLTATTTFDITEDYYQAYARWVPKSLRTTPFTAYLRAGVTYVNATLKDSAILPPPVSGAYNQIDKTHDILGNIGVGVGYTLYNGDRITWLVQGEGEGFFGYRTQHTQESLPTQPTPVFAPEVSIDNQLYGGIGRVTVRFQYDIGSSGLLKAFADAGAEIKYTVIGYSGNGSPNELLWGPFVRAGIRFSF